MSNKSTQSQSVKPVGFVLPYCHGGSQTDGGHPVLLLPEGSNPPEGCADIVYPASTRPDGISWVRGPTVEINGTRFTSYGSQGSKSSKPAQKMIDAELGDSFKRASRDEAMDMLKAQAQAQFRALIANARASRPDLADVPDSELLAAMMR